MVLRHGPQCICQLCTCGRHRCPYDRNASSVQIGNSTESPFQRKADEYAVSGAGRSKPILPVSELIGHDLLGTGKRDKMTSSYHEDYKGLSVGANGVIRRRRKSADGKDQFDGLDIPENDENLQVSSARGVRGRSAYRPPTSDIWRASGPFEQQSTTQADYKALSKGDRYEMKRLDESNVLKSDAKFVAESTTHGDYTGKSGDRHSIRKPGSSEVWRREGKFEDKSVSASDYNVKEGQRYDIRRPADSNVLRGEGAFADKSISKQDYDWKEGGERYEARRPADSNVLRGEGPFDSTTINTSDYIGHEGGDRYPIKKPTTDEIWALRGGGKFEGESIHQKDYTPKGPGERMHVKKPKDSNILRGEGPFDSTTINVSDYTEHEGGDRYPIKKPTTDEVWALREGGKFDPTTISASDYTEHEGGDRYPIKKPTTDEVWAVRGGGKFEDKSVSMQDYDEKRIGERYEIVRPQSSDILKSGSKFDSKSLAHSDYIPHKIEEKSLPAQRRDSSGVLRGEGAFTDKSISKQDYDWKQGGERYEAHKPTVAEIWASKGPFEGESHIHSDYVSHDVKERGIPVKRKDSSGVLRSSGKIEGETVSSTEYGPKVGERYDIHKPKDSEIFSKEAGSFAHHIGEKSGAQAVRGERYEIRRPQTSDIWKRSGNMEAESLTHTDFVAHDVEQLSPAQRPKDSSDVLKSSERFQAQSTSATEYKPGQAVRFKIERPGSSGLWKTDGKFEHPRSVTQSDYTLGDEARRSDAQQRPVPRIEESTDLWKTDQPMDTRTVTQTDYTAKMGERAQATARAKSEFLLGTDTASGPDAFQSISQHDYVEYPGLQKPHEVRPQGELSVNREGTLDGKSVYMADYQDQGQGQVASLKPKPPVSALKLSGERETESGYQKEFGDASDYLRRCLAGELVDGVRRNLKKTPHFKLKDVHHAHYFFEPRTGDSTSSDSNNSARTSTADSQKTLT